MNTPAHSGWLNHGLAMVLAGTAAWAIQARSEVYRAGLDHVPERRSIEYPLHGYIDNYQHEPYLAAALGKTLTDGSSIVLMGSSELTTADHPSKSVNFFNDQLHIPLFALGHDGNQSFSMHAQLLAAGANLANARLAILVSPGWFVDRPGERGTALASFLEYQSSPSLYRIQQRILAGDPLVAPVGHYLAEHRMDIGAAQPITQWITRNASPIDRWLYAFSQPWNAAVIEATSQEMLRNPGLHHWSPAPRSNIPPEEWQALYAEGIAEHLARCTNNTVFVNDDYYAEHVHGRTRLLDVYPLEENRELRDFAALLEFLEASDARPFFVLQPLNPYVYTNLDAMDATLDAIRHGFRAHGFDYFDLWVSDTADFRPGTLTDVMHLGPLGWYRVDSAIAAYFP